MKVQHFFDKDTFTLTYGVYDEESRTGVVIDTVTDYDANDRTAEFIDEKQLTIPYVFDTHAHADHFTGLQYFKKRYGCKTVIGRYLKVAQNLEDPKSEEVLQRLAREEKAHIDRLLESFVQQGEGGFLS